MHKLFCTNKHKFCQVNCDRCVRLGWEQNGAIFQTEKRNSHKRAQSGRQIDKLYLLFASVFKTQNNSHGAEFNTVLLEFTAGTNHRSCYFFFSSIVLLFFGKSIMRLRAAWKLCCCCCCCFWWWRCVYASKNDFQWTAIFIETIIL